MEIVYSRGQHPLTDGRVYRNPRFFFGTEPGAERVYVVGEFPRIVEAYRAAGVSVDVIGPAPARPAQPPPPPALVPTVPEDERDAIYIPGDWRDLPWSRPAEGRDLTLRGLAAMFSAEPVLNKAQATAAIEAEIERRGAI